MFRWGNRASHLGRMKNSSYYIAPVGNRTHDLPHTVASNMVKVSHALNHSATEAVISNIGASIIQHKTYRPKPLHPINSLLRPLLWVANIQYQTFHWGWLLAFEHCVIIARTQKHTDRQTETQSQWSIRATRVIQGNRDLMSTVVRLTS